MSSRRLAAAVLIGLLAGGCTSPNSASSAPSAPTASSRPPPGATATRGAGPGPTTTPIPAPAASPTPRALRPGEDDWGRVPFANGLRDRYGSTAINAMAEAGGRIVAVGRGPTGAAAWVSTDGITWTRAPGTLGPASSEMLDVVAAGPGFVAVGVMGDGLPAAWASAEGITWHQAVVPGDAGPWGHGMVRVAARDGVIVVAGDARVWVSRDGLGWDEVSLHSQSSGWEDPCCWPGDIAAGPPGFLLLAPAPTADDYFPSMGQVLLASTDGRTWRRMAFLDQSCVNCGTYPYFTGIAWRRDRWVAIGHMGSEYLEGETQPDAAEFGRATWTSATTGASWDQVQKAPVDVAPDGSWGVLPWEALTVAPDGRLLSTEPGGRLWVSDDGTSWSRVTAAIPAPATPENPDAWPRPTVRGAAAFGERLLVFGSDLDTAPSGVPRYTAAVWAAPDPGLAEPSSPAAACPTGAPTLIEVIELPAEERVRCFADREVTVRAYVVGRYDPGPPDGWLRLGQFGLYVALPVAGDASWTADLDVLLDPVHEGMPSVPARGGWVWLTGRFDHPKATTCPAGVRPRCRQALLATRVTEATPP